MKTDNKKMISVAAMPSAATKPTATTPKTTTTTTPKTTTTATTAVKIPAAGTLMIPGAIADLDAGDPPQARVNVCWCAMDRLGKALVSAAIVAGRELSSTQHELGDAFPEFVETRTPWALPEALAMIGFAAQPGLELDRLTPVVAVALSQMLKAMAMLGQLYVAEMEQGDKQRGN
jgi:hypothetical protein